MAVTSSSQTQLLKWLRTPVGHGRSPGWLLGLLGPALTLTLQGAVGMAAQAAPPHALVPASTDTPSSTQHWAALPTPSAYVLGAGDRLQIDVFEAPEYSGEFEVLPDGSVRLPFVGGVPVRGLTLDQASGVISQRYSAILRRPIVSLELIDTRPVTLALAGEVNRPGAYTVSDADIGGLPTVTQAIQLAGGITQFANIRAIEVQRVTPGSTQPTNTITVDLWQLLQEGDLRQDIALQDGDRIIVPEATTLTFEESTELASANFSPGEITVNVVGEVGSPGAVQVPPNTPLNQALLAAGGFSNQARRGTIELVRLNPNGTVVRQAIDVDLAADANAETNPPLRPNDTVIVRRSRFISITEAVGRVIGPITGTVGLFRILGL